MADNPVAPPKSLAEAVGRRIAQERKHLRLTKEQLAARAGIASRYLWRVEAGRQNITLKNLAAIADGLGLTLSQMLEGAERMIAVAESVPTRSSDPEIMDQAKI